jgi:hypothetical protein
MVFGVTDLTLNAVWALSSLPIQSSLRPPCVCAGLYIAMESRRLLRQECLRFRLNHRLQGLGHHSSVTCKRIRLLMIDPLILRKRQ